MLLSDGNDEQAELISSFQLLTAKPVIYVFNVDESSLKEGNKHVERLKKEVERERAEFLILAAAMEADISELKTIEEQDMFLSDLGLKEPGVSRLIYSVYKTLKLQTYFTAGKKEVRAWTIPIGATALKAAGVIHSDFEKGFVRAEIIDYQDYISLKSEAKIKEAGKMRLEGKNYIVKDGDIIHFRFNV